MGAHILTAVKNKRIKLLKLNTVEEMFLFHKIFPAPRVRVSVNSLFRVNIFLLF